MSLWDYIRYREGGNKGGNYTAYNTQSGAYGAYQIIPSTWDDIRTRSGLDLPENIKETTNEQQDAAAQWLQKDFARVSKVKDDDYAGGAMSWNYGAGGYNDIMSADPNDAIESVIGYEASKQNVVNGKRVSGMTVGQFRDEFQKEADSFRMKWGMGVVPSDPARSKSVGELATQGKEEAPEEERGLWDRAKNALGILSDAHVAKHQPTPQTSAPPPIMQGGGMPVTPSMPMEARTDVPLRNGLYGPPEEPTDYLNPNLNKYSTAAARTPPPEAPNTRYLDHMGLPTGDLAPTISTEAPQMGEAPLLKAPQMETYAGDNDASHVPFMDPSQNTTEDPMPLLKRAMQEEVAGVPVEEDPHSLSDAVTRSAAETELTTAGATDEEKKQVLEGDPKSLWQRLKKWQSGLSDHRKSQLLAIGAGLLSGRNWHEGFAGASQGLLAVNQQRVAHERQQSLQTERLDSMASRVSGSYNRPFNVVGYDADGFEKVMSGTMIGGVPHVTNEDGQLIPASSMLTDVRIGGRSDEQAFQNGVQGIPNAKYVTEDGRPVFEFKRESEAKTYGYALRAIGALKDMDNIFAEMPADEITSIESAIKRWAATNANTKISAAAIQGILDESDLNGAAQATMRVYLQSVLRADTGAAYTGAEINDYASAFLPSPNDNNETLTQKQRIRTREIDRFIAGSGAAGAYLGGLWEGKYQMPSGYWEPVTSQPTLDPSNTGSDSEIEDILKQYD